MHFIFSFWCGKAHFIVGDAIPELVGLGSTRKQADQTMRSKPVSSTLHGVCVSSCLQIPVLLELSPRCPWRGPRPRPEVKSNT